MKSSAMLLAFYQAWLTGHDLHYFRGDNTGLCANLEEWVRKNHYQDDFNQEQKEVFCQLCNNLIREMKQQFITAGLDPLYPFNTTYVDYVEETAKGFCHVNPFRVEWVVNRLEEGV